MDVVPIVDLLRLLRTPGQERDLDWPRLLLLVSDAGRFMTGAIVADGGQSVALCG
jgi:hypothetical protein